MCIKNFYLRTGNMKIHWTKNVVYKVYTFQKQTSKYWRFHSPQRPITPMIDDLDNIDIFIRKDHWFSFHGMIRQNVFSDRFYTNSITWVNSTQWCQRIFHIVYIRTFFIKRRKLLLNRPPHSLDFHPSDVFCSPRKNQD